MLTFLGFMALRLALSFAQCFLLRHLNPSIPSNMPPTEKMGRKSLGPTTLFGEWTNPHQAELADLHTTLSLISCLKVSRLMDVARAHFINLWVGTCRNFEWQRSLAIVSCAIDPVQSYTIQSSSKSSTSFFSVRNFQQLPPTKKALEPATFVLPASGAKETYTSILAGAQ